MATINVALNVQVQGELQIPIPPVFMNVEAYDKIEVNVPASGSDVTVNLQPGVPPGAVSFLLIKSSVYNSGDAIKLTYTVGGKDIPFDQPQVYLGTGVISLLGDIKTIKFSNKSEKPADKKDEKKNDALIEILVGRKAT
jgi:signal peptidase I